MTFFCKHKLSILQEKLSTLASQTSAHQKKLSISVSLYLSILEKEKPSVTKATDGIYN